MTHITVRYERTKLYEEVWTEAVTKVAKRYDISDVGLRKICRKLAVPLPPLGYWARIAAGQKPTKPPLPKHAGPTEIARRRYVNDKPAEPDPEHLGARRAFEAQPENRIVVGDTLDHPHSLITATERAFRQSRHRDARDLPTTNRGTLDVSVSQASLSRALRIMDALIKALDARGMNIRIESEGKQRCCVTLQGQKLGIRLVEGVSRSEREPTAKERQEMEKYGSTYFANRYSYQPTGLLKLGIISTYSTELQRAVADGKQQRIEQRLNEFVVMLEDEAVRRKREEEERERRHRLWERQEQLRHAREERQRKEAERLRALEDEVRDWKRAQDIRAYVAAVEASATNDPQGSTMDSELKQWIAWARHKADWIDPLIAAKCPILDEE